MSERKILDILIPQYRYNEEQIKPLLDSINSQYKVDFNLINVIIAGDHGVKLDINKLTGYKFNIDYTYYEENGKIAVNRNRLISSASAKYIIFIDEDNVLIDTLFLTNILPVLQNRDLEYISCKWVCELENQAQRFFVYKGSIFDINIHGKIFSLDFIRQHNIVLPEDLTDSEDLYLVYAVNFFSPKKAYMDEYSSELQIICEDSITHQGMTQEQRKGHYFQINHSKTRHLYYKYLMDLAAKNNLNDYYITMVLRAFGEELIYFVISPEWADAVQEAEVLQGFKAILPKFQFDMNAYEYIKKTFSWAAKDGEYPSYQEVYNFYKKVFDIKDE